MAAPRAVRVQVGRSQSVRYNSRMQAPEYEIDLHVHTSLGSPCSMLDVEDLAERVRADGIETVAVTDHENLRGARALRDLLEGTGIHILAGIEVATNWGEFVVFAPEGKLERIERAVRYERPTFRSLKRRGLFSRDDVTIWAHPFRAGAAGAHPPDARSRKELAMIVDTIRAVEGVNGWNLRFDEMRGEGWREESGNVRAAVFAEEKGLPITYGSDAHDMHDFATNVVTCFDRPVRSFEDLDAAIREGGIIDRTERYLGKGWREEVSK